MSVRGAFFGFCVMLLAAGGAIAAQASTAWPGTLETNAPLSVLFEVRFGKGAQLAPEGTTQLDAVLARPTSGLFWLIEGASDTDGPNGAVEAQARADAVRVRLIEQNIPPRRIVAYALSAARGSKVRVRAFTDPPAHTTIPYEPGSAEASEGARHMLDFLAASVEGRERALMVRAFAATAKDGDPLVLAIARAQAARDYLLSRGLPGHRIEIAAEAAPAGPNAERIEIEPIAR